MVIASQRGSFLHRSHAVKRGTAKGRHIPLAETVDARLGLSGGQGLTLCLLHPE